MLKLSCGGDKVEMPVTADGINRFERITKTRISELPDDPEIEALLPVLIWCLAAEINPEIRARDVAKVFSDPAVRKSTATSFLRQCRPNFEPTNN